LLPVVVVTPRLSIVNVVRIPLKESIETSKEMNDNAKMTHRVRYDDDINFRRRICEVPLLIAVLAFILVIALYLGVYD
jgi:hypothetical protein